MSDQEPCTVCGGNEFIKEAGYYYCNECQTQSQDMRERCYEVQDNLSNIRQKSKAIKKQTSTASSNVNEITSWEGYNFILTGLVKQMVELGANSDNTNFSTIVKNLWFKYLISLELVPTSKNKRTKLGAVYRKKDAEIVFKRKAVRARKRRPNKSEVLDGDDPMLKRRENIRQKKIFLQSDYETNTQCSDVSIHSQSLGSLTISDDSDTDTGKILFTKRAKKAMRKKMSASHLRKHINDCDNMMRCHRGHTRNVTDSYLKSAHRLTKLRVYAVLYLGLLITDNKFQLSDLIRFCREGHISYLSYKHFFPETFTEKEINEQMYTNGHFELPNHKALRTMGLKIYKCLKLPFVGLSINLDVFIERYCKELNLPNTIKQMALNLLNLTRPRMAFTEDSHRFPNYEGRAMAIIIYVLKYLFGLDGVTEYKFSTFAQKINEHTKNPNDQMFVWASWMRFIERRKIILKKHCFPIKYLLDPNDLDDMNLYIKFLENKKTTYVSDTRNVSMDIIKKFLDDLNIMQGDNTKEMIHFKVSLTPFHSYLETVMENENYSNKLLKDCTSDSIKFLTHSNKFLKLLHGDNYVIKNNSANTDNQFVVMNPNFHVSVRNPAIQNLWMAKFDQKKMDDIAVEVLRNEVNTENKHPPKPLDINAELSLPLPTEKSQARKAKTGRNSKGKFCSRTAEDCKDHDEFTPKKRGKWALSAWRDNPELIKHNYKPSLLYIKYKDDELERIVQTKVAESAKEDEIVEKDDSYKIHYQPSFESWINVIDVEATLNYEWKKYFLTLPTTFQWLLEECALITEQTPKDLFAEFVNVELYVNYIYLNNVPIKIKDGCDNYADMTKLINKAKKQW